MEALFKWMSELDLTEAVKLFFILSVILALIPYSDIIKVFFRQLILRKELKIHFFEFSAAQNVFAGKDEKGNDLFIDIPNDDIFIVGQKIKLYWKVEGAYRVDIDPIGKKLKGNCAHSLINLNSINYVLTAYGFWGKKESLEISIPEDRIYYLDTTQLSHYSDHIIRPVPLISTNRVTDNYPKVKSFSNSKLRNTKSWGRGNLLGLNTATIHTKNIVHPNPKKQLLYKRLDVARILKTYNFSTKKYQDASIYNQN